MPKISVIVPIYNCEKFLSRCIDSILVQSFADFELVLVNDGSEDKSGEIADNYLKKDNRVVVIHKENGGVSSARNVGIEKASGEYITFVDSDDKLYQNALEAMLKNIEASSADLSIGGFEDEIIDYNNNSISFTRRLKREYLVIRREDFSRYAEYLWSNGGMFSSCAKLFKSDIIKSRGIRFNADLVVLEDGDFVINYLKACSVICNIAETVYCVCDYVGRNSTMHRSKTDYMDNVIYVYNELEAFFNQLGIEEEAVCLNALYGNFNLAWKNLWFSPQNSSSIKRAKYRRIKEVLFYPIIQKIIIWRKKRYLFLEYFFLRMKNVMGLRFIQAVRKKMRKHTKKMSARYEL